MTRLYGHLRKNAGNLFLSPASIRMALAMVYAGAKGVTATQMANTLVLDESRDVHALYAAVLHDWRARHTPTDVDHLVGSSEPAELVAFLEGQAERERVTLHVVNRLWGQIGRPFRPEFLALLKERYGATLEPLDFARAPEGARQAINRWVADQTGERICDLIEPGAISEETLLVLTNAVYFKATWEGEFDPAATRDEPFHVIADRPVLAELMHRTDYFGYGETQDAQVLEIAYEAPDMSMVVVLPKEKGGIGSLEQSMNEKEVGAW